MSAMTPEEKRARRREFYADPFRRALTLRTARRWRDKHKDELNARRREKYASDPVFRAAENARRVKH